MSIRTITARDADLELTHRLSHETATWDDLEGCGTEQPDLGAAYAHLAANGGGWLWFADDDPDSDNPGGLRTSYVGPDHNNPNNWPEEPYEP